MAKRTKTSDTFTFEELCEAVGLKASYEGMEKLVEFNIYYIFEQGDYAYKQAIEDGEDEDKAEGARSKTEGKLINKLSTAYINAAIETIENALTKHFALDLTEVKERKGEQTRWKITPLRTWRESLGHIVETINGVGLFRFDSIREFLDSGPYTEREGVLTHLHYLADYSSVYGVRSLERTFHDNLDHHLRDF